MAYSINLTDAQKTEVTKLIAESASTEDTITAWMSGHLTTTLESSMRERLNEDIDKNWPNREEKKEAIKALDPSGMETEYEKYFPAE
jgi:ABC-type uncharacterized transport system YnjBCD ATPase subunit